MATQTEKVYRISIQTDAAQQAVEAARKRLAALDAQLEGIDKNSEAGRAIVAEMSKLVGEVEAAEGRVASLGEALDNLKPGTIPKLEAEIEELEAALRQSTKGTAEFETALLKLGNAKGELKKIEDQLDIIADTKQHAAAFVDFANGVVGAYAVCSAAAINFGGLSKEAAEEASAKLLSVIAVLDGVQQISKSLNTETIGVVKNTFAAAKGYLGFGKAAEAGSKAARIGLASTGIGLLIVALGALYALWQDFGSTVKGSESNFTKFKATVLGGLQAVWVATKDVVKLWFQLSTFNFSGASETWRNFGKDTATAYAKGRAEVIDEARRAELAHEVEKNKQYVEILKAKGRDTLALEIAIAKQNLEAQKAGSKEAFEALTEYTALRAQLRKRSQDDERATTLVFLNGLAAAAQARGADAFAQQLAAKKEQIAQLNQAEKEGALVTKAQRAQLLSELDALTLAHDKELADKRAALQGATLQAQLVRLQASTSDQSLVELEANAKQIQIAQAHRANLLAQAQVDKAAVVAADADLYKLRLDRSRIFYRQEAEQAQAIRDEYTSAIEQLRKKDEANEQQYQANLRRAQEAGARVTKQVADELAAELALKKKKAEADADIGGNLLIRLFGLTDEQAQSLKARIADVAANVSNLTSALLAGATAEADAALTDTQARLSALTEQLSAASAQRQSDEQALQTATGARREFLEGKIQKEIAAEQRLATEKAKAAREEQAAQKERAKLDKVQNEITATSSVVESVLLGIQAAKAVVKASSEGKVGYDNIALAIAAAVAIGAGIAAMKNAAKFTNGGLITGPSHADGGVPFTVGGRPGFEAEGGEFIFSRAAVAAHGLPMLRMMNDLGNTRVLPHPNGRFATGGQIPLLSAGPAAVQPADLSAMLGYLQAIAAHTGNTAMFSQLSAEKPPIVPDEQMALAYEQKAKDARAAMQPAIL